LKRNKSRTVKDKVKILQIAPDVKVRERRFEIFLVIALFAFGLYNSIRFFGCQVVPNPDFTGFFRVGKELLSLQLPTSYKRAPVVGILQVILSFFIKGPHPDLTAGWLLNASLYPFCIILLWRLAKQIVGRAGLWLAVIAMINPWTIQFLTHPIAETPLLFFILLTFYFIFRGSSFSYLFASLTTMVRYEGAALILAAFVMDMIYRKSKKERIKAFVYSALASVPLGLWMLGTMSGWQGTGKTHYVKELGYYGDFAETLLKFLKMVWYAGFYPLFMPAPTASKDTFEAAFKLSKTLVAFSFVFGAVYGLIRRQWKILALLIFFVPYMLIHTLHSLIIPRFFTVINWISLLICLYGLQSLWELVNKNKRIPKLIIIAFQVIFLTVVAFWFLRLISYLPKTARFSPVCTPLPYVAIILVAVITAAAVFVFKVRRLWPGVVTTALLCLLVVSNQFVLVGVIGDGQKDMEFKLLADWYVANAKPGERLVSTMSNIVAIFAPEQKDCFLGFGPFGDAEGPEDFVKECYRQDITYVIWDSRLGLNVGGRYYKLYRLDNIKMLARPRSIGPFEFLKQIRISDRRFLHIFRLRSPSGRQTTNRVSGS